MTLPPLDPPPLDPRHLAHYLAICAVAHVQVAPRDWVEMRALLERLSRLSIPDGVKLLQTKARQP